MMGLKQQTKQFYISSAAFWT